MFKTANNKPHNPSVTKRFAHTGEGPEAEVCAAASDDSPLVIPTPTGEADIRTPKNNLPWFLIHTVNLMNAQRAD